MVSDVHTDEFRSRTGGGSMVGSSGVGCSGMVEAWTDLHGRRVAPMLSCHVTCYDMREMIKIKIKETRT